MMTVEKALIISFAPWEYSKDDLEAAYKYLNNAFNGKLFAYNIMCSLAFIIEQNKK